MIVIDSRRIKYSNKKIIKIKFEMHNYLSYNDVYILEKNANGECFLTLFHGQPLFVENENFLSFCQYLIEELKILDLKPEYSNDGVLDGYGWELEIEFEDGIKFESYGVNKKPRKISKLIKSFEEIIFPRY